MNFLASRQNIFFCVSLLIFFFLFSIICILWNLLSDFVCTFWGLLTVYMVSSFSAVLTFSRSGTLFFVMPKFSVGLEYKFKLLLLNSLFLFQ